jgi:hypothetical protein
MVALEKKKGGYLAAYLAADARIRRYMRMTFADAVCGSRMRMRAPQKSSRALFRLRY